ncbi:hypothetical protein RND81_10G146300 [Saponaria officinalis]|uniref:Peptidase C1A papain C-terminal domain-containing protein n=1 Tax=Saponaria officinalis TaxID=3572 RepID=A0AAW1I2A8_SAPOF
MHASVKDGSCGNVPFEAIDWRCPGVAPVKDQGHSPSCSAHACSSLLELYIFLKYNINLVISAQDLWNGSNNGINIPSDILNWVKRNGVVSEVDSTWLGKVEKWKRREGVKVYKIVRDVLAFGSVVHDWQIAFLLRDGPVIVELDVGSIFFDYEDGFYHGEIEGNVSDELHCAVVVALKVTDSRPYYVFQNSYGCEWGINGFFHVLIFKKKAFSLDVTQLV